MRQALATIRARREHEEGFTLIELMVVVLIIAILIAIAIPTFLGARTRAQDKASQSALRNGVTAAKTLFSDTESYTEAAGTMDDATLQGVEPSLDFIDNAVASTDPEMVSVLYDSSTVIVMASESKSGSCYATRDTTSAAGAGTEYGKVANGACTAANAGVAAGGVVWGDKF